MRGRQASGRGAALVGSGCAESRVRRGRGKRRLWLWRAPWAAQSGPGAAPRGCRQHRGALGAPGPLGGRDKRAAKPAEETN